MYATVSELKELKEWLLGGCKDINEQPRTELEKEIKRLNHIVSNKDKAIKELQQDNQELRKANQAYLSYQFKLEEKIKAYEKNIDYWKDEISSKQEDIEVFKNALTYWQTQSKEIALAKNPNEELKEQKNYFENESLLKDNITIVTDIELLEKENKALEQSEETLFKKNQELITANQILKKSVDELTDVISLKERDIKDLVDKNNELKNELEQARKSSYIQGTTKEIFTMPQDKVREYNEKIKRDNYPEDYTYKLDNNDLDINNSIGTIYGNPLNLELQRECIELKDDLKLKTAELNTYIAEYESLEQKKINLEVDLEEQKSLVNTTRKLWEKLEKENGNLKNEVIELQANLIEAKKLLEDSLLTIESLESTIKDLKKDNSNLKEVNNKMFQSNEKLSKEIENLNLENSKVWNRNRELEDTNKKFIDLNTNLEKELLKTKQLLDIELNKNIPF